MKTLSLLLALTSLSAGATDVTLNIEGNIYDTTCQVDSASQNMVVDLDRPSPVILRISATPARGKTSI